MSDLISRQELYDKCVKLEQEALKMVLTADDKTEKLIWNAVLTERLAFKFSIVDAPASLSNPSVDQERKKGKWIDEKINSYTSRTYCSECCSSAPFVYESDDYYGNHAHGETAKTKFCPNCGADMRGE